MLLRLARRGRCRELAGGAPGPRREGGVPASAPGGAFSWSWLVGRPDRHPVPLRVLLSGPVAGSSGAPGVSGPDWGPSWTVSVSGPMAGSSGSPGCAAVGPLGGAPAVYRPVWLGALGAAGAAVAAGAGGAPGGGGRAAGGGAA